DDPFEQVADQRTNPGDHELWTFRRILARKNFEPGAYDSDVVLVNWPMIDYLGGTIVDNPDAPQHLEAARQLSLSMLYWLQTEAPRPDGGTGWPGLRLRGDVVGNELTGRGDGLAQAPYIRESRRIRAQRTVLEQDLSVAVRGTAGAVGYPDSVGVGMYRIDLHPSTGGDNYIDVACSPFQIPLGALLPQRLTNLIAAGKNLGTTHITNGCYRLHPVEWNVGEVAGLLAAHCLDARRSPDQVRHDPAAFADFHRLITAEGIETAWPAVTGY
ncbi:MAG TPA: FAD-dependent oxidoreductase, partial [Microlunatus sp.]|nr:FAD-dependent oxidoreductase [Microlunatus sp.]